MQALNERKSILNNLINKNIFIPAQKLKLKFDRKIFFHNNLLFLKQPPSHPNPKNKIKREFLYEFLVINTA